MPSERNLDNTLQQMTLGDSLVSRLRQEILGGQIPPGTQLPQNELAERFGISRMPVRDALRELGNEGLVSLRPGRVAEVASLKPDELQEAYEIREVLEELAAQKSISHLIKEDLQSLADLIHMMEEASQAGDVPMWLHLDHQFHTLAYSRCGRPRLMEMIESQ